MNLKKLNALTCTGLAVFALTLTAANADSSKMMAHSGAVQRVMLDPAASTVGWLATKVTGKHHGSVKLVSGEVAVENGAVKGGSFVVDMTSITDLDLTDAEYNKKLTDHLKSDDFFSVEKNPTAQFKIISLKPIANPAASQPNYNVTGDLTIKGLTHSETFPALIVIQDGKASAKGTMTVDRTQFNIRFRSGRFYENLGDTLIHDQFKIDLNLVGSSGGAAASKM